MRVDASATERPAIALMIFTIQLWIAEPFEPLEPRAPPEPPHLLNPSNPLNLSHPSNLLHPLHLLNLRVPPIRTDFTLLASSTARTRRRCEAQSKDPGGRTERATGWFVPSWSGGAW